MGNLQLENIYHIDYHFLQVKDWTFVISKEKNDTHNSGWLINSLKRMSSTEKRVLQETDSLAGLNPLPMNVLKNLLLALLTALSIMTANAQGHSEHC